MLSQRQGDLGVGGRARYKPVTGEQDEDDKLHGVSGLQVWRRDSISVCECGGERTLHYICVSILMMSYCPSCILFKSQFSPGKETTDGSEFVDFTHIVVSWHHRHHSPIHTPTGGCWQSAASPISSNLSDLPKDTTADYDGAGLALPTAFSWATVSPSCLELALSLLGYFHFPIKMWIHVFYPHLKKSIWIWDLRGYTLF